MLNFFEAVEGMLVKGPLKIEQTSSCMDIRLISNNLTIN